jgi:hypothetical protein
MDILQGKAETEVFMRVLVMAASAFIGDAFSLLG